MTDTVDFLIIGGGVVGLTVALEIRKRHRRAVIRVLEKEDQVGAHASGRNSGVLHAGFYYTPDSLKAQLTRDGCAAWTEYHEEFRLPIRRCGKLVVTQQETELRGLRQLFERGQTNDVELEWISAEAAREIEPRVRTVESAIWSPSTASVDPGTLMTHLGERCEQELIQVCTGTAFVDRRAEAVVTTAGSVDPGYVINAAGLHADRVARSYGFGSRYRVVPFRGAYLYGNNSEQLQTHIYPVPDSRFAFLGVHFTVTPSGGVKIGPTAMPGLWREHYGGLGGFVAGDAVEVATEVGRLLVRGGQPFRRHALSEVRKLSRHHLVGLAGQLAEDIDPSDYTDWGRPGIRAQLVDRTSGQMVDDFVLEGDNESMHILNAVSPAFTCALPFAAVVADRIESAP